MSERDYRDYDAEQEYLASEGARLQAEADAEAEQHIAELQQQLDAARERVIEAAKAWKNENCYDSMIALHRAVEELEQKEWT